VDEEYLNNTPEGKVRRAYRDAILSGNKAAEDAAFSSLYAMYYGEMMLNARRWIPSLVTTPPDKLTPSQVDLLKVAMIAQWTGGSEGSAKFFRDIATATTERRTGKLTAEAATTNLVKLMANANDKNNRKDGTVIGIDKTVMGHVMSGYGLTYKISQSTSQMPLKQSGVKLIQAFQAYSEEHPYN
jgi:hypothetical protein